MVGLQDESFVGLRHHAGPHSASPAASTRRTSSAFFGVVYLSGSHSERLSSSPEQPFLARCRRPIHPGPHDADQRALRQVVIDVIDPETQYISSGNALVGMAKVPPDGQ